MKIRINNNIWAGVFGYWYIQVMICAVNHFVVFFLTVLSHTLAHILFFLDFGFLTVCGFVDSLPNTLQTNCYNAYQALGEGFWRVNQLQSA